jgi:hypothetical protein
MDCNSGNDREFGRLCDWANMISLALHLDDAVVRHGLERSREVSLGVLVERPLRRCLLLEKEKPAKPVAERALGKSLAGQKIRQHKPSTLQRQPP